MIFRKKSDVSIMSKRSEYWIELCIELAEQAWALPGNTLMFEPPRREGKIAQPASLQRLAAGLIKKQLFVVSYVKYLDFMSSDQDRTFDDTAINLRNEFRTLKQHDFEAIFEIARDIWHDEA